MLIFNAKFMRIVLHWTAGIAMKTINFPGEMKIHFFTRRSPRELKANQVALWRTILDDLRAK